MASRLLRMKDVQRLTGLGKSAIYAGMNRGTFPHSVALSERTRAWVESEVEEWVERRIQNRKAGVRA